MSRNLMLVIPNLNCSFFPKECQCKESLFIWMVPIKARELKEIATGFYESYRPLVAHNDKIGFGTSSQPSSSRNWK
jgi:hypothetical protein